MAIPCWSSGAWPGLWADQARRPQAVAPRLRGRMAPSLESLEQELAELIAIPSVSADAAHATDVLAAAEWVRDRILRAGRRGRGRRLARTARSRSGEVRASRDARARADGPLLRALRRPAARPARALGDAAVRPPPPGRLALRARHRRRQGAAVHAAEGGRAARGRRASSRSTCASPATARRRSADSSIVDWLAADERGADAAVVFDSGMQQRDIPEFNIAMRGLCYFHVEVRTGAPRPPLGHVRRRVAERDACADAGARPQCCRATGDCPEPLREGVVPPTRGGARRLAELQPGAEAIAEQGARPMDARAAEEFYLRTWAEPSVDVHGIAGGSPRLIKTVLPGPGGGERLDPARPRPGPGRRSPLPSSGCSARRRPPARSSRSRSQSASPPALVPPDAPAVQLGLDAFEHVVGRRPLLVRSGGSIPLVAALSARGIPALVTGFGAAGLQHPFAERTAARGVPAAGRRHSRRALPPARKPSPRVSAPPTAAAGYASPLAQRACRGRARPLPPLRPHRHAGRRRRGYVSEQREAARPLAPAPLRAARPRPRGRRADGARLRASRPCPARSRGPSSA